MNNEANIRNFLVISLSVLGVFFVLPIIYYYLIDRDSTEEFRKRAANKDLEILSSKIDEFAEHGSRFPESLSELVNLPDDLVVHIDPLIRIPKDRWGLDYDFNLQANSSGKKLTIMTLGEDGMVGGSGEDKDIVVYSSQIVRELGEHK